LRLALPGAIACVALGAAHAAAAPPRYEYSEPHMGTTVRVVLYAADRAQAERAARAAFARIAALDQALSDYRPDSELMRLCARAGQGAVAIGADLFRVLEAAQALAERSRGAFDATSGQLTRLWRGARRLSELPAPARIADARAQSGYRRLQLDATRRTAMLEAGVCLDLGGIAKGDAADQALAAMAAHGVARALVAIGGDVAVAAPPPGEDGWTVEVAALAVAGAPRIGELRLRDAAVSTSGDAEQWMPVDGRRYSHILDPRNGWPMTARSSTTVVARRGIDADGLATAAAVLGPGKGLRLVERTPGAAAFMTRQEADGGVTVHTSSRWSEVVHLGVGTDQGPLALDTRRGVAVLHAEDEIAPIGPHPVVDVP